MHGCARGPGAAESDRQTRLMINIAHKRIVVIGAGIVGASLAYHLARLGARVTVVEAGEIACGVTSTSFAWINTSCAGPDPIALLRGGAIDAYRRLEKQLPGLNLRWSGALCHGTGVGADHAAAQPPAMMLTQSQVRALEPALRQAPRQAWYAPEQGALDAVAATQALIAGAKALGATILTHTAVSDIVVRDGQVTGVETANGVIDADLAVLAAGTGITALLGKFNVALPIDASPAIFMRYAAPHGLIRTIISSDEMEARQAEDGTLLAAEDYIDGSDENQAPAIALRAARAIRHALDGADAIEPQYACIGKRPMPADGVPIIGYLPTVNGVYVCVMHPGVTLAAIAGRLASEELVMGKVHAALEPCRPERFLHRHAP